jgi:hypothetical protein
MPDTESGVGPAWLGWLADAPMFIDGHQVGAFYDAVVRPVFRPVELQLTHERVRQLQESWGGKLDVTLTALFSWLKLGAGAETTATSSTDQHEAQSIVLQPVETPSRQLVELCLHYLASQPERICFYGGKEPQLPADRAILRSPRMIAFVDASPGTMFLPLAAELNDGRVVTFFDPLAERQVRGGGDLPGPYPDELAPEAGEPERDAYWEWFERHWNPNLAVQVVEDVIGTGGRPRWIAYRVRLSATETLDLNVVGRGDYDTGIFAYDMVKRGWKYGLRIVGGLKSKPTMNVLAIYEK